MIRTSQKTKKAAASDFKEQPVSEKYQKFIDEQRAEIRRNILESRHSGDAECKQATFIHNLVKQACKNSKNAVKKLLKSGMSGPEIESIVSDVSRRIYEDL